MNKSKIALALAAVLGASSVSASGYNDPCEQLPGFGKFKKAVNAIVDASDNGGLDNEMWVTAVNRAGVVCAIAKSGKPGEQWPGSRIISAQKANTANAFSLPGMTGKGFQAPLSTAQLFTAVQPGGSLFGLQHSNPVRPGVAYVGDKYSWGTRKDPLVGKKIGGVNVFGGGVALYNEHGDLVGALGVSGDTSCTDHIVTWKIRDYIGLDNVPGGVSLTGDDNMIQNAISDTLQAAFEHPLCGFGEETIVEELPETHPIMSNEVAVW